MNDKFQYQIRLIVQTLAGVGAVLSFVKALKLFIGLFVGAKCILELNFYLCLYGFALWVFNQLETKK